MSESIREWYRKTTARSMRWLIASVVISSIGAALFFALVPSEVHSKIQIFNGAITIPVAGLIWIVTFIVMWLVPMRETAFRSQESMERMETRFEERLQKVDKILERFDRMTEQVDAGNHPFLNKIESHVAAIRSRIDKQTEPLPAPRRPRQPAVKDSDALPGDVVIDIQEMEDLHAGHGTGD